jgi:hypothetical protein
MQGQGAMMRMQGQGAMMRMQGQGAMMRMQGDTVITENSNMATEKQQNMIRAVCKSMGKVPPHNLQSFTKSDASKYIDGLKAGEQPAPTYDSPEEPF